MALTRMKAVDASFPSLSNNSYKRGGSMGYSGRKADALGGGDPGMELEQKGLEMGETLDEIIEGIFELLAEQGKRRLGVQKVAFDFCYG